MSIRLDGTLQIKSIQGRNGTFSVGVLVTDIGTFKVKDVALEQYQSGSYPGQFVIAQIFPASYVVRGQAVIEVRATLEHMEILSEQPPQDEEPGEPDPLHEQAAQPDPRIVAGGPTSGSPKLATPPVDLSELQRGAQALGSDDESLFGAEIYTALCAGTAVKLDPTIERPLFRQQRDRMGRNGLGWVFDPISQSWTPPKQ